MKEGQLAQSRPANTTAASLYSPSADAVWIAKTLVICNTSGSLAKARVFHDENGTTYDETTALIWDMPINADETAIIEWFMAGYDQTGNVGIRTDTADALTFTLYGAEI